MSQKLPGFFAETRHNLNGTKNGGRPEHPLDFDQIQKFLSVGMPVRLIAQYFNCTEQTLRNRCGDLIAKEKAAFAYKILEKQFEVGTVDKDSRMLVHLGKVHLGQNDQYTPQEQPTGVQWNVVTPTPPRRTTLTASERQELEGDSDDGAQDNVAT